MLNRTTRNSMSLIDREKVDCWKFQKFKWTRFQIMIVFCFDSWQATDFLKKIITNIYNFFVFAEILTSFRDHFMFFCKFMIHHSICISWLDSNYSTAKHLDSLHSNNNFSKHFLCFDCHERGIIYHWKRHRNLVQFYILAIISRNEMHFSSRNVREDSATNVVFSKISKNIKINRNDQFLWWWVRILECSMMTNHVLIFDWQWIFQYFQFWWVRECFIIHSLQYAFLSIWNYLVYIKLLEYIKFSLLFSWLCNLSHLI